MNYVSLEVVQYATQLMQLMNMPVEEKNALMQAAREEHPNENIPELRLHFICEYGTDNLEAREEDFPPCKNAPAYLIPDATRLSAGGDIEGKPAFFCREHTTELIGHELEAQPIFGRIENPGGM